MFDTLTDKLSETFRKLSGRGALSESNIEDAMREIRLALLDADVNYKIVKEYVSDVREACLGESVLKGVNPGQMAKKIVHDHLVSLMGEANAPLELDGTPATIMMVGLHGSGKTTTSAKLALHLKSKGKRPLLVAADLQRPAAIDQLEVLAGEVDVAVYVNRETKNIAQVANEARAKARHDGYNVMIFDTAGRLQVAEDLVQELVTAKHILNPSEILLVADAALGQEAVSVATHFNEALEISGIILTKLDGDARGGAALSMRKVTGRPIKFVGVGEKYEDLQAFYPDRMADRILGMGDVVSLVEDIEEKIDEEEAKKLEEKMLKNQFDFDDFLSQLRQLKRLGGMASVLNYLPGGRNLLKDADIDEGMLRHVEAVIHSMTPYERQHPEVMNMLSRRQRVANGAGRPLVEVQQLMKRFDLMRGMMSQFGKMSKNVDAEGNVTIPSHRKESQRDKKKRRKKNRPNRARRKK